MHVKRKVYAFALAATLLPLAACGGSDSGGGGSSADATAGLDSRGPITYVQGKDNSGTIRPIIAKWNKAHPDEEVTLKEQSDQADQQHDDLVKNFQAKNADYDVVSVDVVWTAEFAAKQWLQALTGDQAVDTSKMLDGPVKAATYNGTLYAGPTTSDGGLLFYRTDLVKTPPKTWDEMMGMCSIAKSHSMGCYAGQFSKYEGLTVNASEAINGAGGTIVDATGAKATVDSPESAAGLSLLADAYADGNIPKEAITYQEEQGRIAFEAGNLLFLRNWPYVYSLAGTEKSSKVIGKFGVAQLPGADGPGKSSLGGHSTAVSVYSDHKATAVDFVKYLESEETQSFYLTQGSQAPVLASLYDDPALQKKYPFLTTLKESIATAEPRPITPFYPAVTVAIQDNAYAAIKGDKSVEDALKDMSDAIDAAATS